VCVCVCVCVSGIDAPPAAAGYAKKEIGMFGLVVAIVTDRLLEASVERQLPVEKESLTTCILSADHQGATPLVV